MSGIRINYQPPEPMFNDTLLAFKAFDEAHSANVISALIEDDPLGPVNKIVTLMAGQRRIRSALAPIRTGSVVTLGKDEGSPLIRAWGPTWQELAGHPLAQPGRPAGWYVDVDGRRVLEVPEYETWRPIPPPPHVPWWRRARRRIQAERWTIPDAIAKRLGYHRDEHCERDW